MFPQVSRRIYIRRVLCHAEEEAQKELKCVILDSISEIPPRRRLKYESELRAQRYTFIALMGSRGMIQAGLQSVDAAGTKASRK